MITFQVNFTELLKIKTKNPVANVEFHSAVKIIRNDDFSLKSL
ncbi:hypothetical protein FLAPXU55_02444 [Flavobacterium panici]|uniref:Uncharacterized protein n=1 Tax=Flavobacterium panici TaxID=2654843 RepID=A0A9N8P253_9FLAO|nr:hypothetical protein FLAPXU55_02444 [Flavobacterium panici]